MNFQEHQPIVHCAMKPAVSLRSLARGSPDDLKNRTRASRDSTGKPFAASSGLGKALRSEARLQELHTGANSRAELSVRSLARLRKQAIGEITKTEKQNIEKHRVLLPSSNFVRNESTQRASVNVDTASQLGHPRKSNLTIDGRALDSRLMGEVTKTEHKKTLRNYRTQSGRCTRHL